MHEAGQLVKHSRCLAPGRPDSHRGAEQEDGRPKNLLSTFDEHAAAAPFGTPVARYRIPKKRKLDSAHEADAPEPEPLVLEAHAAPEDEGPESCVDPSDDSSSESEDDRADPFRVDAEDHAAAAAASYVQLLGRASTGEPCASGNERATARERASERTSERAPSEANEHATSEREQSAKS